MSETELDYFAWIEERASDDWPFTRWSVGTLPLRDDYDYNAWPSAISGIGSLHHRLREILGRIVTRERLRQLLDTAIEIIDSAIEQSDLDAYSTWMKHEVWLPVLDDSLNGLDAPADMLVQSIEYVGVPDGHSEEELLAALGVWLIGEMRDPVSDSGTRWTNLVQYSIACAGAEFYRGRAHGRALEARKVLKSTQKANDQRHAANRERIQNAERWWIANANGQLSAADAARKLSAEFHVVEPVAKRWIRQFQRKNSPTESRHSAT